MVHVYSFFTEYKHPWETATQAVFQKYPNPFSTHVLSSDVIEQRVNPDTGALETTRLFLKKGKIPEWGRQLMHVPEAFIIEHSTVDPLSKTMVTRTRNLSYTKLMLVEEQQTYSKHPENESWTSVAVEARIISNTSFIPIRSRIEGFGLTRFKKNTLNSIQGLAYVMERLRSNDKMLSK